MALGRALLLGVPVWHAGAESGASQEGPLRAGSALVCPQRSGERVSMRSTDRLPEASGAIQVECRGGTTLLDVEVDSMRPASLFGGDYNTHVLWVVPPRGAAENPGEILLMGSWARLRSRKATEFAALASAEPPFLVSTPSSFVVLESRPDADAPVFRYAVLEGVYNFEGSTLADLMEARGKVHTEDRNAIDAQARETVRFAVAAQHLATDRELQDSPTTMEGSGGGKAEP